MTSSAMSIDIGSWLTRDMRTGSAGYAILESIANWAFSRDTKMQRFAIVT